MRCPRRLMRRDTTLGYLSLMAFKSPSGNLANSVSRTAITVVLRELWVSVSTIPTKSPRPYSPTNSFLPSWWVMTERRRPLSTMYVQSDSSPCLKSGHSDHWTRSQLTQDWVDVNVIEIPIKGTAAFDVNPVESKINLSDEGWKTIDHRSRQIKHQLRLFGHQSANGKRSIGSMWG